MHPLSYRAKKLWQNVVVCAYCTEGPYEEEMERLSKSLQKFDVARDLWICGSREWDWKTAVRQKPKMLAHFLMRHNNRPVLMVDADARFCRDPRWELPNTWDLEKGHIANISMHRHLDRICSGTIIALPNSATFKVIDHWISWSKKLPNLKQPQSVLEKVPGIDSKLSARWCWIFDLSPKYWSMNSDPRPIIEHLQASREYYAERPSNKRLIESRRQRLKELGERE